METNEPALLELRDAVVRRAGRAILSVDAFRLAQGEHIAVLGPNGSGKSTFVNLITREVLPLHRDEPPVRFMGRDRVVLAEVKRHLGIVSATMQSQISVHLPAVQVVEGGLFGTLGVPPFVESTPATRARALETMDVLGVADLAQRDIMTLSTGQARRILIARALVHDPGTLVFDEPCTGLDPEGMHYVRSSMRLLAQAGKGVVLVTHYPEDVIPEIKRLVLIKEGKLFADGPKEELLTNQVMSALFEAPLQVERRRVAACRLADAEPAASTPVSVVAPACGIASEEEFVEAREDEYFSLVSAY